MPVKKTFIYDTSCQWFTIVKPRIFFDTPREELKIHLYIIHKIQALWVTYKINMLITLENYISYKQYLLSAIISQYAEGYIQEIKPGASPQLILIDVILKNHVQMMQLAL